MADDNVSLQGLIENKKKAQAQVESEKSLSDLIKDKGGIPRTTVTALTANPTSTDNSPSVLPWYARIPANLGISAVEGAVSGVLEPIALANAGADWLAYKAGQVMGLKPSDRPYADSFLMPAIGGTRRVMKGMGLIDNPVLAPQSTGEKLAMAAMAGGASALSSAPLLGGASTIESLAPWVFSGMTGGVGGEAVNELIPENWKKEHPYLATTASAAGGLAGGLAGGGVIGGVENALTSGSAKATYQAAHDYADVAKGVVKWNKRNIPGQLDAAKDEILDAKNAAQTRLDSYAAQQLSDADNSIERIAAAHGDVETKMQAGEYAQKRFREWLNDEKDGMPGKMNAAQASVRALIPRDLEAGTSNLENYVNRITELGGSLDDAVGLFRPHIPDRLKGVLDRRNAAVELGADVKPVTYKDLDALRDAIGDARGIPSVASSTGQEHLNGLYHAVAEDQRDAVKAMGNPDALTALDAWNAEANRLFNIKEKVGKKLVTGKNPSPSDPDVSGIVDKLTPSDLGLLRQEIPDAVDQIAAHHLRRGKGWTALEPEEQVALVPNPAHRVELDLAHDVKNSVPKNLEVAKKAEEVGAQADIVENSRMVKREQDVQRAALDDAKEEVRDLKAQIPGTSPARQEHKDLITFLAAEKLVPKLLTNFNIPEDIANAIGGPLGLGITHGLRGVKSSPYGAIPGTIGGEANPLLPDIEFTAPGRTSR